MLYMRRTVPILLFNILLSPWYSAMSLSALPQIPKSKGPQVLSRSKPKPPNSRPRPEITAGVRRSRIVPAS